MRQISDEQRRARLGVRHGLAQRRASVEDVVRAMTCLHATEPASVYLSARARADVTPEDLERALYEDRTVTKQLAMRRTVFAFPTGLLPAAWGSASARVQAALHARLAKEVEANGVASDGDRWVSEAGEQVLRSLRQHGPLTTAELRERLPALSQRLETAPGKSYGGSFPVAPRVLSTLAASGRVLRGVNAGDWRLSRPRWTLTEEWLDDVPEPLGSAEGYRVLVESWLRGFGPGTEADLVWWLGSTKAAVRRALGELGAVEVQLSHAVGYLLPDDLDDVPAPEPWAALLPTLDPTTMGWRGREFYLDPEHVPLLFDTNGNAGTTAWWNGRVVGCWAQDPDGVVAVVHLGDVPPEARRALEVEAERLSTWLGGQRVATVYASPLMRTVAPAAGAIRPTHAGGATAP